MEYLGWECSPVLANVTSSWNNKHLEIGESFVDQFEDSNCCGRYEEGKMEYHLPGDIFIPIQHLHENITEPSDHHLYNCSNSEKVSELIQHLPQEAVRLAGTALAKSGGGTSWGEEASTAEFYSNSPLVSGLVTHHFGMQPYDINGFQMSAVSTTTAASLESLDCLLSATNSNTDTSVEDDAINSMFFSDHCKNLWNFAPISSRESESNRSITTGREKAVSQCSSQVKPKSSTKRSIDKCQFFQEDHSSNKGGDFGLISENPPKPKKPRMEKPPSSSNINFQQPSNSNICVEEPDSEAIAQMKEMIYRAAAFRPVNLGEEVVEKPKRKNVKISSDPQTVAARQRREKISEKIRVLQRLVPGGSKMDTATMLDEAANYLRFLRSQVKALETLGSQKPDFVNHPFPNSVLPFNHSFPMQTTQFPLPKP